MSKADDIASEVRQKIEDYETNMSGFMQEFNEWAEIYKIQPPTRGGRRHHRFSNPRTAEMFRAVSSLATLEYRMLTAQDPYFEMVPMEMGANAEKLNIIEATLQTQLRLSEHKRYLLKACTSQILTGTVIVEEPWKIVGVNNFGRRMPVTGFIPRSMLSVAFDRQALDLNDADWIATMDVVSDASLRRMGEDDEIGAQWDKAEIEESIREQGSKNTINPYIDSRLSRAGYTNLVDKKKVKELTLYHGKLDTMNDGIDYVVGLVNREHVVRFHANKFRHGRRPFRIARWNEFELESLGLGLGKLLAPLHRSMDANRQKTQDSITMATYNMWIMSRLAGINNKDMKIRPMNIVPADDINGIRPLPHDLAGADAGLKLEEFLRQEFRNASGATDSLQAIVTGGTATETSLAQNEAIRAVSVRAELSAEPFIREHLEIMHMNNVEFLDQPFNVNVGGNPIKAYPEDMMADVDFRTKITTDKDYKPERLKQLIQTLQVLTSIRNARPDIMQIDIIPFAQEIAKSMNIDPQRVILPPQQVQVNSQQGGEPLAVEGGPQGGGGGGGGTNVVQTPAGPTLQSP